MEHGQGPAWAVALEATPLAAAIRESYFLYPLANVLHIFGVALLFGSIVALDLRLLGVGRGVPLRAASGLLTPLSWLGFALIVPSGLMMFVADAGPLVESTVFRVKMLLLLAALLNALAFRWLRDRHLDDWDHGPPPLGRAQAALSLMIWPGVIVAGRMLGYL
jgi:hypothetical protein